jgi:hypothetical protein
MFVEVRGAAVERVFGGGDGGRPVRKRAGACGDFKDE